MNEQTTVITPYRRLSLPLLHNVTAPINRYGAWLVLLALFFSVGLVLPTVLMAKEGDTRRAFRSLSFSRLRPIKTVCESTTGRFGIRENRDFVPANQVFIRDSRRRLRFYQILPRAEQRCAQMSTRGQKESPLPAPSSGEPAAMFPPIPLKAQWEAEMITFGRMACDRIHQQTLSFDELLTATYYDATAVFLQIERYLGDPSWRPCAERAASIYRDSYVFGSNGIVPGFWSFTRGMYLLFLSQRDNRAVDAIVTLARNATFAPDQTPASATTSSLTSREVAYTILAYLHAEAVGAGHRGRLDLLVTHALGHLREWRSGRAEYVRPFMVGLTMQALISYFEATGDEQVKTPIFETLDWLWTTLWIPQAEAFPYTDRVHPTGGTEPAPDLNLPIAPAYAWAYFHTGDEKYLRQGDAIFTGGINRSWLYNTKQFHQNYLWSFRFVEYREGRAAVGLR